MSVFKDRRPSQGKWRMSITVKVIIRIIKWLLRRA